MQRIIAAMADREGPVGVEFDFVMVAGHFLARDENIFTFFEGQGVRTYEASKIAAPLSISKQVRPHLSPGNDQGIMYVRVVIAYLPSDVCFAKVSNERMILPSAQLHEGMATCRASDQRAIPSTSKQVCPFLSCPEQSMAGPQEREASQELPSTREHQVRRGIIQQ